MAKNSRRIWFVSIIIFTISCSNQNIELLAKDSTFNLLSDIEMLCEEVPIKHA